jgi:AbrB family looped-hinge helix DNA binding protein
MSFSSTLSSKGQVTIPQEIRIRLGLKEGDRVEFVIEEGRTILRPERREENPFEACIGALGPFPGGVKGIDAWLTELRGGKPKR